MLSARWHSRRGLRGKRGRHRSLPRPRRRRARVLSERHADAWWGGRTRSRYATGPQTRPRRRGAPEARRRPQRGTPRRRPIKGRGSPSRPARRRGVPSRRISNEPRLTDVPKRRMRAARSRRARTEARVRPLCRRSGGDDAAGLHDASRGGPGRRVFRFAARRT